MILSVEREWHRRMWLVLPACWTRALQSVTTHLYRQASLVVGDCLDIFQAQVSGEGGGLFSPMACLMAEQS